VSRHLLLTGGTGFLGAAIARQLAGSGRRLHVLARAGSARGVLAGLEVCWHAGDLEEHASLAAACGRIRREIGESPLECVHNAALVSYRTRDGARMRAVNVEGTRALLAALGEVGVERTVHVSSVVAVGHSDRRGTLDESATWNLAGSGIAYAETKRTAEEIALSRAPELGLTVVNPGAISGPTPRASNATRFLEALREGRLGRWAPPGGMGVVGVEDVARGIHLALERGRVGQRYILVESHRTHLDLFRDAANALGVRPPRSAFPAGLWPAVVAGARLVDRLRPLQVTTPQSLRMLGFDFHCSAESARRELDWEPEPFSVVLARTLEYLFRSGALRAPSASRRPMAAAQKSAPESSEGKVD
jgi:dihydroflavonol-4-reductase